MKQRRRSERQLRERPDHDTPPDGAVAHKWGISARINKVRLDQPGHYPDGMKNGGEPRL
jgi:hypothetical protein